MSFSQRYLFAYNAICVTLWSFLLYELIASVSVRQASWSQLAENLWQRVAHVLLFVQSLATLEIFHALFRLVRSPVTSTAIQISSRLFITWFILFLAPPSRSQIGFLLVLFSWSFVETVRYSFYAYNLLGNAPKWLFFLRYHTFLVLYPTGVYGTIRFHRFHQIRREILCDRRNSLHDIIASLLPIPCTKSNPIKFRVTLVTLVTRLMFVVSQYVIELPNKWNIALSMHFLVILVIITYVPGLPVMYSHMLRQRTRAYAKIKQR